MEYLVCENVFVPLRSGPSHKSEMLSQVLFGEKYTIIEQAGRWVKIELVADNYRGWIDLDHIQQSVSEDSEMGSVLNKSLLCYKTDKSKLLLEPGCEIYKPDFRLKTFTAGTSLFTTSRDFDSSFVTTEDSFGDTALRFINSPYIWGGRIPSGMDCSGMTQLVYKIHGIKIPRDARQQSEIGTTVNFITETKPGDLVFFDNESGIVTHVGMILSAGLVIHASGRVRIDTIDHQGIFKQEISGYSHHLRVIKRVTQ